MSRWDDYLSSMGREGTWAGHMELQAASQVAGVNITVHQAAQPAWTISNWPQVRCPITGFGDLISAPGSYR